MQTDVAQLKELLQQAQKARDEKSLQKALDCYDELLEQTAEMTVHPNANREPREYRLTALRERSRLLEWMGDRDQALQGYEAYYLEAGSTEHAVEALVLIGDLHNVLGRHRQALDAYDEALHLAEAFNHTPGRAKALLGAGLTLHRLGRSEEALSNLRQALGLFEQLGDQQGLSRTWNRLGIVHVQIGQIDRAIDAFQKALELARKVGDRETAIELSNLGECHQQLFNMEQALAYHRDALALAESTQFHAVQADLCRNLGFDLCNMGQVEEGISYLQRALAISEETKDRDSKLQALYSLVLAEVERGNIEAARDYATQLREVAEARNYRVYQADALHALGMVHREEGELELAEQRWQEAVFLAHDTGRQFLLWQIHSCLAEIADNPGLARVHYQIAADIINQIAYPIEDETIRCSFLGAPAVKAILKKV